MFNQEFPQLFLLAADDLELGEALGHVWLKEKLSGFLVVESLRNDVLRFLLVVFSSLVFLFNIFDHFFQASKLLDKFQRGSRADSLHSRKIVASAENAEINELVHRQLQFPQHGLQGDLNHWVLLLSDPFDQVLASESQAVHII